VTNASLNPPGSDQWTATGLKSSVTNGETTSAVYFNTDVGMGSAADVLSESRRIALMTSSVVSGRNCRKETPGGTRVNVGAGASAVLTVISLGQLYPQKTG